MFHRSSLIRQTIIKETCYRSRNSYFKIVFVILSITTLFCILFFGLVMQRTSLDKDDISLLKFNRLNGAVRLIDPEVKNQVRKFKDWTNYTFLELESKRVGPGERGAPFILTDAKEVANASLIIQEFSHNGLVSDKISLDRSLPDIRHPVCHNIEYYTDLPAVSVIIVFHNEYLSSLLRTVHSVVNRSPAELLKEIILVDDNSDKEFLNGTLDEHFINFTRMNLHSPDLIRIIRLPIRAGLIRARMVGINATKSDIVVVMDAHMEVCTNWLPPLVQPIVDDWRVMTEPALTEIHWDSYEVKNNMFLGDFESFNFDLLTEWHTRRPVDTDSVWMNYENPTIVGAMMAINKTLFWHLGGFDEQLEIYGAEQFDISFKVWMCIEGGRILTVPCSIVAHNYKSGGYHPFFKLDSKDHYLVRNINRVVSVFFDEPYKVAYFETHKEDALVDPGDLTKELELVKQLHCKPWSWYLNNVYPEFLDLYPLEYENKLAWGLIRSDAEPEYCINTNNREYDIGVFACPSNDTHLSVNEDFILLKNREIHGGAMHWKCWDAYSRKPGKFVTIQMSNCKRGDPMQLFTYDFTSHQIKHGKLCLEVDFSRSKFKQDAALFFTECNNVTTQMWTWSHHSNPN